MQSDVAHVTLRLVLPLFLASAALAQKVIVEYDHSIDFSHYRKYDWKEHPFLKKHPESQQFTVGADLVRNNVNEILMKRGYAPADGIQPEFFVAQFIAARLGQETHSVPVTDGYPTGYMWAGYGYAWNSAWFTTWDTYVENFVQGILLLDVVDAKTNQLLWRAVCKTKIDDMRERHKDIEDAVKKALKSFPPKFK